MTVIQKPTKSEYKDLKDFKFRVGLEFYNAIQLHQNSGLPFYEFKVGNTYFKVKRVIGKTSLGREKLLSRNKVDEMLNRFTTTRR